MKRRERLSDTSKRNKNQRTRDEGYHLHQPHHPVPHPDSPRMPPRLTFQYNPLSYAYPDDESDKPLFLQASSTLATHPPIVLVYWINTVFSDGEEVWQVVRLVRRDAEHIRHVHAPSNSRSSSSSSSTSSSSSNHGTIRSSRRDDLFKYIYPDLIVVDGCERDYNATFSLGVLTRDQREAVLECAEDVAYDPRSDDEGQCTTWMSELLKRLVREGLVARGVVEAIMDAVPLLSSSASSGE
ncbi:hypothetical protein L210DRAFT_3519266 [Boletus edulis BED1]|uniref:Uncharacterized protein n=1 Tax=Boletus edulis BED1 TaxID=1328754 RepID=A0AAD4C9S6_BOLED|nr:hypothetical protein L210DRAFT_3519266 [Boletus edulis BED1]